MAKVLACVSGSLIQMCVAHGLGASRLHEEGERLGIQACSPKECDWKSNY